MDTVFLKKSYKSDTQIGTVILYFQKSEGLPSGPFSVRRSKVVHSRFEKFEEENW